MESRNVWSWRQEAGLAKPVYFTPVTYWHTNCDIEGSHSGLFLRCDVSKDRVAAIFKDMQSIAINIGNHLPTDTASHARSLERAWNANWCEELCSPSDSRIVCV